jgi:demethylspheroidene O-methyltransferase
MIVRIQRPGPRLPTFRCQLPTSRVSRPVTPPEQARPRSPPWVPVRWRPTPAPATRVGDRAQDTSRPAARATALRRPLLGAMARSMERVRRHRGFQRWAARFPLTRPVALRRSRALFDLVAGFVYTQTLYACVELGLFDLLAKGPLTAEQIGAQTGLPPSGHRAAQCAPPARSSSCQAPWRPHRPGSARRAHGGQRRARGAHPAPRHGLRRSGRSGDPAPLRSDFRTELSRYWPYADAPRPQAIDDARVASYSEMMAATLPPLASDVLDAYDLSKHRCLLDVGGGEGVFLSHAGARHRTCSCSCSTCRP